MIIVKNRNPLENKRKKRKVKVSYRCCKPLWLYVHSDPNRRIGIFLLRQKVRKGITMALDLVLEDDCMHVTEAQAIEEEGSCNMLGKILTLMMMLLNQLHQTTQA